MSKAEERALEAYPFIDGEMPKTQNANAGRMYARNIFKKGYEQAEKDLTAEARLSSGWDGFYYGQGYKQAKKDLELTWKDIEKITDIWDDLHEDEVVYSKTGCDTPEFYQEVLERFNKERQK